MRYAFDTPTGWSRSPFPPPQRGVYLRAPVSTPSEESASLLLFDALAPAGTLEEQLEALVKQGSDGVKLERSGRPSPVRTAAYPGLSLSLSVQVDGAPARDELRVFILIDAGSERLPVAFIGGPRSLPLPQPALDAVLASIGPLDLAPELYGSWIE